MAEPDRPPGRGRGFAGSIADVWPPRRAAQAGGYIADTPTWSSLLARLKAWARAEAGAGRLLPWVPVAFGAGIALYFAADHEPVLWAAAALALMSSAGAFLLRRHRLFPVAVMIAAIAAGFAVATARTARLARTLCWPDRCFR
jgi:competence protein ComEC